MLDGGHMRRDDYAMAVADFNDDGRPDYATVSDFNYPDTTVLLPLPPVGGPYDGMAFFGPGWAEVPGSDPLSTRTSPPWAETMP